MLVYNLFCFVFLFCLKVLHREYNKCMTNEQIFNLIFFANYF